MMITLQASARAPFPFCTGIIRASGGCAETAPFLLLRQGALAQANLPEVSEGLAMMSNATNTTVALDETAEGARRRPVSSRRQVVSRLWRTAERQVSEIETRMTGLGDDPQALERDARTLAVIAKTVRDLVAIDSEAALNPASRKKKTHRHEEAETRSDADAAFGPRDIEGFRAELARRLDELHRERTEQAAS